MSVGGGLLGELEAGLRCVLCEAQHELDGVAREHERSEERARAARGFGCGAGERAVAGEGFAQGGGVAQQSGG